MFLLDFKPIIENVRRRIRRGFRCFNAIVPYEFVRVDGIRVRSDFRRPGFKIGELNSGGFENGFRIMEGEWEP